MRLCAALKGTVFNQFSLGQGIEIREFWSRIGYHLSENYRLTLGESWMGWEFVVPSLE